MNRWTGEDFFDLMELDNQKKVLEIGIGTGRLARNILEIGCKSFTGIDISQSTIERAKHNLSKYTSINLIKSDFMSFSLEEKFDVIYSALTFMHIEDKANAILNISRILSENGVMIISFFNVVDEYLDFWPHKVKLYPNDVNEIIQEIENQTCEIEVVKELKENGSLLATVIKARKK
jgi:ubiquinone/menaquinone biosynthesis C-methylase UbiE